VDVNDQNKVFVTEAGARRTNVVTEVWDFVTYYKKWWLVPILLVLLAFGILMLIGGTVAAPFIYTLF